MRVYSFICSLLCLCGCALAGYDFDGYRQKDGGVDGSKESTGTSASSSSGGVDGGCACSPLEYCDADAGTCQKSACQVALKDANTIPNLDATSRDQFLGVLNCVCHDPATSSVCGSNLESQTMCGNAGWDTGNITQDFLDKNPIGPCCSMQCASKLAECRNQL